jgi:hypothetical protein
MVSFERPFAFFELHSFAHLDSSGSYPYLFLKNNMLFPENPVRAYLPTPKEEKQIG